MSKVNKQVEAKLKELEKEVLRTERLLRRAFCRCEELNAVKAGLVADIEALRKFREQRQRNTGFTG